MKSKKLLNTRRVKGWTFQLVEDEFYQCRGEVMYDDEHDETPEPSLWLAAIQLQDELLSEGYEAEANHSEKGWVEVTLVKE
tara:strand:+ start:224 stop:466 length:243 start_codon:yes stop_codon:yes gene_type:complete